MIILSEVAEKVNKILNNEDPSVEITNPLADFQFETITQGFHIDSVADKKTGKNFVPVFVSAIGGAYNPVPELKQAQGSIPITFYFPVRFKNHFFVLNGFLADVFVGKILNFGSLTGNAVCNISLPNFGEIVGMDLKEFERWVTQKYRVEVDIMENWMSMTVNLYLSNAASGFVYGNEVVTTLSIPGTQLSSEVVVFDQQSIQSHSQTNPEQELGTNEVDALPFGTSYGVGFAVYYKNNDFFNYLLTQWFGGNSQTLTLVLTTTINNISFTRTCYIESANLNIKKGELLTISFSFAKRTTIQEIV